MTKTNSDNTKQAYYLSMRALVEAALNEDIGRGDLTSLACLELNPVRAQIVARSDGVLSGVEPALMVFDTVDSANKVRFLRRDGESFAREDVMAEIDGFNQTVLASERVALNFLGHLSGLATTTRRFVEKVQKYACEIRDTRKTTPGWRLLEKAAVRHGGGVNHRMGLYDMVLIKENHIRSAGSITEVVRRAREYCASPDFHMQFDREPETVKIEVEVTCEAELREAAALEVDGILLDNQPVKSLHSLVKIARSLKPDIVLEASGNVSLDNVADIAATGVDQISIGTITHSAPCADFSLLFISE